jgi:hypothetical protein
LLIITTSKVSPPVAVDMVILARAWFSGSVTNLRWIPGFSASNCGESLMASVICEFETMAMVTMSPPEPSEPAPAHPDGQYCCRAEAYGPCDEVAFHGRLPRKSVVRVCGWALNRQ